MLFKLLLDGYALTGTAGRDQQLHFNGRDAAAFLGYRAADYFVKNYCTERLKDIVMRVEGFDSRQLETKYIEYHSMLRMGSKCRAEVWNVFGNLPFTRVKEYRGDGIPVVRVEQTGVIFLEWINERYLPVLRDIAASLPQQPTWYYSPRSPSPPQQQRYTPRSPDYTPPSPPQQQPFAYTPRSPDYTPPSPPQQQQPFSYNPTSPDYSSPSPQQPEPGSSPSMSPLTKLQSNEHSILFMGDFPPKKIKISYKGQLINYIRQ